MSSHACSSGCACPLSRGLTATQAADEAQAAREGGTPVEAEVDRLRTRVRELEAALTAEREACAKTADEAEAKRPKQAPLLDVPAAMKPEPTT